VQQQFTTRIGRTAILNATPLAHLMAQALGNRKWSRATARNYLRRASLDSRPGPMPVGRLCGPEQWLKRGN
jgi:hypothetical protein